jgi:hypothetical protein
MKTELNMWTVKTSDSKGVVASGLEGHKNDSSQ